MVLHTNFSSQILGQLRIEIGFIESLLTIFFVISGKSFIDSSDLTYLPGTPEWMLLIFLAIAIILARE